jgi:DNA segregation ATPase FtsK/SpoIIIE, S-DNA-T family
VDLSLTVVVAASGARIDLTVTAPDAALAAPVLEALRAATGVPDGTDLSVSGRPLAAEGSVADCGLLAGSVVVAGAERPAAREPYELITATGPDAGRRMPLRAGETVVGRAPGCGATVDDPAASREHLRIERLGAAITAVDLGSANGSILDGSALPVGATGSLAAGSRLRIGDSELVLSPTIDSAPLKLEVRPGPRLSRPPIGAKVDFPARPAPPPRTRLPILAAVAPLVAGLVLALVLHQWQLLAFTVLSPIMVGGQAISDRRFARRSARAADATFATATAAASQHLDQALAEERRQQYDAAPDLAALVTAVGDRGQLLWHRRAADADAISLRLGRGDRNSDIVVTGTTELAVLTDVPLSLAMAEVRRLGVCGPRDLALAMIRSLVLQATAWNGPSALRLVVLAPLHPDDWAWVRWLPHSRSANRAADRYQVAFDEAQVALCLEELAIAWPGPADSKPWTLVVLDGASSRTAAYVAALAKDESGRLTFITCVLSKESLPADVCAVASLAAAPRPQLSLRQSGHREETTVVPDLVALDVAEGVARSMAPLRDSGWTDRGNDLPHTVRWTALEALDLTANPVDALSRRWGTRPSTAATLGEGPDGPLTVDLARDGPHALIAGTTGSGKSELLLSLVASLVAANRPDQLALLLFDHKGGAAFARCAELPHTVGVVTDLDSASTRRALLSLTAELRRREARFAAATVADLDAYVDARQRRPDLGPLPRLVIVVDEFAALADEQPELIQGLVGIAQRGRSLGVHLVLATQRPDGMVSADIRANTRLRICLGVTRESESRDVIDSPVAATISRTAPGRGYLRIGHSDLREFQSGRVTSPHVQPAKPFVRLTPVATIGSLPPVEVSPQDQDESSDLDVLIEATRTMSRRLGCSPATRPWLPPLSADLTIADLGMATAREVDTEPPLTAAPWGLVDLPGETRQEPLLLDLTIGSTTVISGASRSGRTTGATSAAMAATAACSPDQLQLWAIGNDAALAHLAELPHSGATVPAADGERVERLLAYLSGEVARRRSTVNRPGSPDPLLMLVIDSWEDLTADHDHRDAGRLTDLLLSLAADGPSARLLLVITAGRAGLTGRLASASTNRITLRLADPADYLMLGLPTRQVPRHLPPGRGFRAADLALVQLATTDVVTTAQARRWPASAIPPVRLEPLPTQVRVAALRRPSQPVGDVLLGLAANDLSPVVVPRREIGASFLVAGPAGSGRTTALTLLASQRGDRRIALSCLADSPLLTLPDAIVLPRDDQEHAVALLDSLFDNESSAPDLIVDDADLLLDGPLTMRIEDQVQTARPGRIVVLSGSTDALLAAFRGPVAQARRAKSGLLLCPSSPLDGELFGARLPRRVRGGDPPGRGWLIRRGALTRLQLAQPDEIPASSASRR